MISVIIRNRNEQDFIGFAIQSCLDFFADPEIIIVDNNSTDESLKIVKLFDKANIKIISIDDYTPGRSINLGVENATHDTILILSAHSQLTNVDLPKVKKLLDNYCAVMGQQTPIYRGKKITKRYVWSHFIDEPTESMFSKIENRQFLHNAFCFYSKKFLKEYPMPENYAGKEDRYWAIKVVEDGHDYFYDPNQKCNHYWTPNGATWKGIG